MRCCRRVERGWCVDRRGASPARPVVGTSPPVGSACCGGVHPAVESSLIGATVIAATCARIPDPCVRSRVMRIAVTGATGLVGTALGRTSGRRPRRGSRRAVGRDRHRHLLGSGVGATHRPASVRRRRRRRPPRRRRHRRSPMDRRLQATTRREPHLGTTLVAETIARPTNGPTVLLSGSAIGFYGARGDEELDETSRPASGFLSDLCASGRPRPRRRSQPARGSSICAPASCCRPTAAR